MLRVTLVISWMYPHYNPLKVTSRLIVTSNFESAIDSFSIAKRAIRYAVIFPVWYSAGCRSGIHFYTGYTCDPNYRYRMYPFYLCLLLQRALFRLLFDDENKYSMEKMHENELVKIIIVKICLIAMFKKKWSWVHISPQLVNQCFCSNVALNSSKRPEIETGRPKTAALNTAILSLIMNLLQLLQLFIIRWIIKSAFL